MNIFCALPLESILCIRKCTGGVCRGEQREVTGEFQGTSRGFRKGMGQGSRQEISEMFQEVPAGCKWVQGSMILGAFQQVPQGSRWHQRHFNGSKWAPGKLQRGFHQRFWGYHEILVSFQAGSMGFKHFESLYSESSLRCFFGVFFGFFRRFIW